MNEGPWCTLNPSPPSFHVLEPSPDAIFFLSFVFLSFVTFFHSLPFRLISFSQSPLSLTPTSHHLRLPLSATHHQLHLSLPRDLSLSASPLLGSTLLLSWWLGVEFDLPKQAIALGELLTLNLLASLVFFLFQEESKMCLQ